MPRYSISHGLHLRRAVHMSSSLLFEAYQCFTMSQASFPQQLHSALHFYLPF